MRWNPTNSAFQMEILFVIWPIYVNSLSCLQLQQHEIKKITHIQLHLPNAFLIIKPE